MSGQGELEFEGLEAPDGPEKRDNGTGTPGSAGGEEAVLGGRAEGPLKRLIDDNFLQYASYVIRDRAIPDLDDGLKPVQRRILYSLHENDDGKFIKVANIAGYCMQYHPHGNVSIEDALTTLANKQHLIEGQGNFGNLYTGDPPAASRYIECRLTELARTQLFNDKLTRFVPSYDGRRNEPVTLPAKLPLLLMLGAEGIAVGLSTKILPHNLVELLRAQVAILQKKPFSLAPDFQQGGRMDITEYNRGNGKVRVRAVLESASKKNAVIVRELPFGVTTDSLISSIEDAARKKRLKIRSISDFTSEKVEIEIHLSPGEDPEKAIPGLYAFTACEQAVSCRAIVIHDNRPVEMDVESILRHVTKRLVHILKRELELEKKRLTDELHFKTLAQLFVEHRIYKQIEECETYPAVQKAVLVGLSRFREQLQRDVTLPDAEKLLAIPIKRISRFDIQKNRKEIGDIIAALGEIEKSLSDVTAYAIRYVKNLLTKCGKGISRRTQIETFDVLERRELAAEEYGVRWDREKGYIGHTVEGDELFTCSSYDKILLVWNDGCYQVMHTPEKLFVDQGLIHCAPFDRDQDYTIVFTHEAVTFMKRFTFGGAIMNRDYSCSVSKSKIWLLETGVPDEIFVKYKRAKNQRINQQVFHPGKVPLKGAKARGNQITVKEIAEISTVKPRGWSRGKASPRGAPM